MFTKIKWFIQRGIQGYADCDTWGLDEYFSQLIARAIRHQIKISHGYPSSLKSHKKWVKILTEIAEGFEEYKEFQSAHYVWKEIPRDEQKNAQLKGAKRLEVDQERINRAHKKVQKALTLFKRYFYNLWD